MYINCCNIVVKFQLKCIDKMLKVVYNKYESI